MIDSHRIETLPGRDCATLSLRGLLLAAVASIASSQRVATKLAAAPKQTEIAPRGQREVKDVAYGDWKKLASSRAVQK